MQLDSEAVTMAMTKAIVVVVVVAAVFPCDFVVAVPGDFTIVIVETHE